jgi:hypothetical protein
MTIEVSNNADTALPIEDLVWDLIGSVDAGDVSFSEVADRVEAYQRTHCPVYGRFEGYRFLPVEAFKLATVTSFPADRAERVFVSSGTGSQQRSRHYIADSRLYERSVLAGFDRAIAQRFVWQPGDVTILGHLPAYAQESSLVAMVSILIEKRGASGSQLFLEDTSCLDTATRSDASGPVVLFGAAFGLLDLLDVRDWILPTGSVVIETGGMKTHRREISREALHHRLSSGFGVPRKRVVSEYGMCELLSQCYTDADAIFRTPPWMRHYVVDPTDPTRLCDEGQEGILAFMDLANVHTVSAVLTQDRAVSENGGFRVLGRMAEAELRGCNFLLE